jgi:DNA invertase Pin-like site-specific DNA recombinase
MMLVGYARVSSAGQSLDIQREQLAAAGCERVFEEKKSGRAAANRPALQEALRFVREGDMLVVTRLDRLARSVLDLEQIAEGLRGRGVSLKATEQPVDTSSPTGTAFFQMLGVFAQLENALRRDRQMEGIAKAKAEGRHLGRPSSVPVEAVEERLRAGEKPAAIARELRIGRASVYRVKDGMAPVD